MAAILEPSTRRPASLYRFFDKDSALLYVGISVRTIKRVQEHKEHSAWFFLSQKMTIEHFASREEALVAETNAIQNETPKYNIQKQIKISPTGRTINIEQKISVKKEEEELKTDYEYFCSNLAKQKLIHRIVNVDAVYTIPEIQRLLGLKTDKIVKRLIDEKKLGASLVSSYATRNMKKEEIVIRNLVITGWQFLDYLQSLERV